MNKELNGNVIEQAIKVTSFRKVIREVCRKNGLEYPSDEKVAEWIEQGYPFEVEPFITDYKGHNGIFRTPLEDFKSQVNSISWANKPTDEEIVKFYNKNGNNIRLFCEQRTISEMKPLERKVYLKTISTLDIEGIVVLWNLFIEESALYGEDSCIYDLSTAKDSKFLSQHMSQDELKELCDMVVSGNGIRFIQWLSTSDNSIKVKSDRDIKSTLTAYWGEIFERIMQFPMIYAQIELGNSNYFDECVWSVIQKELGY